MNINCHGALTLLHTQLHKLGIDVVAWHQNTPSMMACKVCNEDLVGDKYHMVYTFSTYSTIRQTFDDILRGCDKLGCHIESTT